MSLLSKTSKSNQFQASKSHYLSSCSPFISFLLANYICAIDCKRTINHERGMATVCHTYQDVDYENRSMFACRKSNICHRSLNSFYKSVPIIFTTLNSNRGFRAVSVYSLTIINYFKICRSCSFRWPCD